MTTLHVLIKLVISEGSNCQVDAVLNATCIRYHLPYNTTHSTQDGGHSRQVMLYCWVVWQNYKLMFYCSVVVCLQTYTVVTSVSEPCVQLCKISTEGEREFETPERRKSCSYSFWLTCGRGAKGLNFLHLRSVVWDLKWMQSRDPLRCHPVT